MRILILGGYGNFGKIIAQRLHDLANVELIIAGRNLNKAKSFASKINAEALLLNTHQQDLADILKQQRINLIISTAGPFQEQDYFVAKSAITAGCHYIDLADGRTYVCGIGQLDASAKAANVFICSGASSVPGLSSAVVNACLPHFTTLRKVMIGISTSEKAPGEATLNSLFAYCGKPVEQRLNGQQIKRYGWQDLTSHKFAKPLGRRSLAACDIPDLQLFPAYYKTLDTMTFSAGTGLKLTHFGTWLFSWLIRWGIIRNPKRYSSWLHKLASKLEFLGNGRSGMYVELTGLDKDGKTLRLCWELIALNNAGVNIPCLAAVALAKKLIKNELTAHGASPCIGLLSLEEYLEELKDLTFTTQLTKL